MAHLQNKVNMVIIFKVTVKLKNEHMKITIHLSVVVLSAM